MTTTKIVLTFFVFLTPFVFTMQGMKRQCVESVQEGSKKLIPLKKQKKDFVTPSKRIRLVEKPTVTLIKTPIIIVRAEREKQQYQCNKCPFLTNYLLRMQSHQAVHEIMKEKPKKKVYSCVCGYLTYHKWVFKEHQDYHSGERKHPCPIEGCSFVAIVERTLKRHIKSLHEK